MNSARWERIQEIFHEVSHLPPGEQENSLCSICGDDADLISEVQRMLSADRKAESLLDRGLPHVAYQMIGTPLGADFREFGPYHLERILGEGGMGVVWLARRKDTGHLVAIKFLPHAGLSPARRERFARETRTLAKLKHPFIARLYDAGTLEDGTPWFVMEYVEGVRLSEYVSGSQSTKEKLELFSKICEAVQYAHGQEIIHRDLKPSNILVEADGAPRLLDFGIARELHKLDSAPELTRPELRFVSPNYAAPEWIRAGIVGFSTDVYSLGVILYEMLTGQLPDAPPSKPSSITRSSGKAAGDDLDVLCLKAIRTEPAERYQSVEALLRDINHFLRNEPLEARAATMGYRLGKFVGRNRRAVFVAATTLGLLAALTTFYTVQLANERNRALAEAQRTRRIQRFMMNMFGSGDAGAGPSNELRVVSLLDRGARVARTLNADSETQGELYETLGTMYQLLGQFKQADALQREGLRKIRMAPGHDRSKEVDALVQLGLLRGDEDRVSEGEQLVRQAMALAQRDLARDDPELLSAKAGLGRVLLQGGFYDKAIKVLEPIVQHPPSGEDNAAIVSQSLAASAIAQQYLGHYDAANSLNRRALVFDRQTFGETNPHVAQDLANLASTALTLGRAASAEALYRQSATIFQAWYGPDHPETAQVLSFIALAMMRQGKEANADALLKRVLMIQEQAYGKVHPNLAFTLDVLGKLAKNRGDSTAAEAYFRRALSINEAALGGGDYRTAISRANLGSALVAEKKYSLAEPILRDAATVLTQERFPGNISVGIVRLSLGRVLFAEKRYREAEKPLMVAQAILGKEPQQNAAKLDEIRRDLVQVQAVSNHSR